jgi:hypothetical protein
MENSENSRRFYNGWSMTWRLQVAIILIAAAMRLQLAHGDESKVEDIAAGGHWLRLFIEGPSDWDLAMINGEIGLIGTSRESKGDTPLPQMLVEHIEPRVVLLKDGHTLQVSVAGDVRKKSKAQAERHLWYLTGDYSEKVPKVKLTKEPNEFSRWKFVIAEHRWGDDLHFYYIQNDNLTDKEGWLCYERPGVQYKDGREFRRLTLSLHDKETFAIPGTHYGGK